MTFVYFGVGAILVFAFIYFCVSHDKGGIKGSQAFSEAFKRSGYWIGLIVAIIVSGVAIYFILHSYNKQQNFTTGMGIGLVASLAVLLAGIIGLPVSIKADPIAYLGTARTTELVNELK